MIQRKPPSKKKTIISVVIVIIMFGGMAWMLFGSTPPTDTFIPAEPGSTAQAVPSASRLDSNLFRDPLFTELIQQGGILPIDPTRIGRANPFVPVSAKKP